MDARVRAHGKATAGVLLAVGGIAGSLILANPASAVSAKSSPPVNLISDPGAEHAKPASSTCKVAVPGWSTAKGSQFTAVAYGASGFPSPTSPGPVNRGKNFFAGGCSGNTASASQVDSLASYTKLISAGQAKFRLSAWLGGYSSQGDYATLTVTWEAANGAVLGHRTIGPVTPAQRKNVTGLLFRSATGKVPKAARKGRITLHMEREDGEYNDGYADNLSLTIAG